MLYPKVIFTHEKRHKFMVNRRPLTAEEIDNIIGEHKSTLEKYIKQYVHKKVEPITENVYIVYEGDDIYDDLTKNGCRGRCDCADGYIYLTEDFLVKRSIKSFIHEYIHRLSRNCFNGQYIMGISSFFDGRLYYFNEAITEMIAIDITGISENDHPYLVGVDIVRKLCDVVDKNSLIAAYFNGDITFFEKHLGEWFEAFSNNIANMMYFFGKANSNNSGANDIDECRKGWDNLINIISWLP